MKNNKLHSVECSSVFNRNFNRNIVIAYASMSAAAGFSVGSQVAILAGVPLLPVLVLSYAGVASSLVFLGAAIALKPTEKAASISAAPSFDPGPK
jgi:hypothetical protein